MNRFESLARRLVLFWGLALGCDGGSSAPPPAPPGTNEPGMTERAGAAPGAAAPHPTDAADPAPGVDVPTVSDPGGPAPGADVTTSGDASAVYAEIEADIRALKSLAIAHVRHLVVDGVHASSCYGVHPCATSANEPSVAAEYARQAPRLDRLTAIAQAAAASPTQAATAARAPADVAADLAALNGLRIVTFGQLVTVSPANNPTCYNLPCATDVAAAEAENARRAAVLHTFAREATAAGL